MSKSRYIGNYPVIGIRPIVDGRRGPMQLRESLARGLHRAAMVKREAPSRRLTT